MVSVDFPCSLRVNVAPTIIANALITRIIASLWLSGSVVQVVSVSASYAVGRWFAPRSCHTKDHYINGRGLQIASLVKVGDWQYFPTACKAREG